MKKIAIFSSGNGSNAENIIKYFKQNKKIKVELILSNNSGANVLNRAKNHNVDTFIFTKNSLKKGSVLKELNMKKIDFIVLAGFLLKIPEAIISCYKNKSVLPSLKIEAIDTLLNLNYSDKKINQNKLKDDKRKLISDLLKMTQE